MGVVAGGPHSTCGRGRKQCSLLEITTASSYELQQEAYKIEARKFDHHVDLYCQISYI